MTDTPNNVSNKEALKDKIHEIHNYLRNNGAGYGMNALKVFNIIYGLKKIEETGLLDTVRLMRPDCEFSYLLQLARERKDDRLAELIFGNVLQSICDSELKDLMFYEIPQNIRGSVFAYLIKEIDRITTIEKTCNVLLSGKIYEYFIGRDESAISELGAYFTDRHIVEYILSKLDPAVNPDGSISSMIDMFGGSGGFTTGYINYMNTKYPRAINWATELHKISHFDMNEDVIKSAGLEFFCLTGILPDMRNLKYKNSFTDEFDGRKYTYPLTNPPYGGDKTTKTDAKQKRDKLKKYIKNELPHITDKETLMRRLNQIKYIEAQDRADRADHDRAKVSVPMCSARIQKFAKDNKLPGNDKESCSLMLLMDIVAVGGTAIGVLKEGVLFNKKYTAVRKCLVENFNVREVISVPQDQFENTSTKTSIIIFDNTAEKTTEILFSELVVGRYAADTFAEVLGTIIITENKGDITGVHDIRVARASKCDISRSAGWSLDGKTYSKPAIRVAPGYALVKLADVCEFLQKSKRTAAFGQAAGQYNFYTSSDRVQKCDVADYADECLILGSGGVANIKIDANFSCSADNILLKSQHGAYIYSFLKGNMHLLIDGFTGSTLKHLSKTYVQNIQVAIPTSPGKLQEWVDKIWAPYREKIAKQTHIAVLETLMRRNIHDIVAAADCDSKCIGDLTQMLPNGKYNTSFGKPSGRYKFYNSSNDEKLFCDEYVVVDESVIIGFKGNINVHFGKKFTASQHMYVLQISRAAKIEFGDIIPYLYAYLKTNEALLTDRMHGTTIKHITKPDLNEICIKIPKNKQLLYDVETLLRQIETLRDDVKAADELHLQYIRELAREALMPPYFLPPGANAF